MIKAVLDANIYISSIFWEKGNPHKIIEKIINQEIQAFISNEILEELKKVLKRDFDEPNELIEDQIKLIKEYSEIIETSEKINIIQEDADDNKIIECAISANANYIITGDNHLLKLKEFRGIKIVNSKDFLEITNQEE